MRNKLDVRKTASQLRDFVNSRAANSKFWQNVRNDLDSNDEARMKKAVETILNDGE